MSAAGTRIAYRRRKRREGTCESWKSVRRGPQKARLPFLEGLHVKATSVRGSVVSGAYRLQEECHAHLGERRGRDVPS